MGVWSIREEGLHVHVRSAGVEAGGGGGGGGGGGPDPNHYLPPFYSQSPSKPSIHVHVVCVTM